jgi:hypothetical protein
LLGSLGIFLIIFYLGNSSIDFSIWSSMNYNFNNLSGLFDLSLMVTPLCFKMEETLLTFTSSPDSEDSSYREGSDKIFSLGENPGLLSF